MLFAAPLEEAFLYVADFRTATEWDPGIVQSRRVNNGPIGKGATYDVTAVFRGSPVPFRYELVEYEENRRLLFHAAGARTETEQKIEELVRFVREAGRIPVQRDTLYNELRRW